MMNEEGIFKRVIKRLSALFGGKQQEAGQNGTRLRMLLDMIEGTDKVELPCDEVFELLDEYVELALRDENAASLMPLVHKHLERCKDCREEYEALRRVIEASPSIGGYSLSP